MQKGVNLRPTVSFAFSNNNTQVSSSFLCLTTPSNNACSLPWTTSTSTPEVFWARRVGNELVSPSYVSRFFNTWSFSDCTSTHPQRLLLAASENLKLLGFRILSTQIFTRTNRSACWRPDSEPYRRLRYQISCFLPLYIHHRSSISEKRKIQLPWTPVLLSQCFELSPSLAASCHITRTQLLVFISMYHTCH